MKHAYEILGYDTIKNRLAELANSMEAKALIQELEPFLVEAELKKQISDTTQARLMLDKVGLPPVPSMDGVSGLVEQAVRGELLSPDDVEKIGYFLTAVRRLKDYLGRGKQLQISIAYYDENLRELGELAEVIGRTVRNGRVDDYASSSLRDIRKALGVLEEKMNSKAELLMRSQKAAMAENFLVKRNGRICLPVKKDWKGKVQGSVVDKSSTGATLFIEPESVAKLREEFELMEIEEDNEVRRILYEIAGRIAEEEPVFVENIRVVIKLDFLFAKGKLSVEQEGVEPLINTERRIELQQARHPMLPKEECVPLDFTIGGQLNSADQGEGDFPLNSADQGEEDFHQRGVIITGPNTGGKTVTIKTVGLLSLMACSGLHIPCVSADICMNSQVLCDIGDGQDMADNLSTFSAHITNIIDILSRVNRDSLVILDELGSGTDPAEGMGIAIAILEELRLNHCLFLVTTHYPEVKTYAMTHSEICNARMAFDRKNLKPLYRLEIGQTGESCALYIAKRLGLPGNMIALAAREAYGPSGEGLAQELLQGEESARALKKLPAPKIVRQTVAKTGSLNGVLGKFSRGDCVSVFPEDKIGIVVKAADEHGEVLVQVKKEKKLINHKRLKLKVAAAELYPEDYDFSIIFDTVANRKAHHKMETGYREDLVAYVE